jgi:hypothetical protein
MELKCNISSEINFMINGISPFFSLPVCHCSADPDVGEVCAKGLADDRLDRVASRWTTTLKRTARRSAARPSTSPPPASRGCLRPFFRCVPAATHRKGRYLTVHQVRFFWRREINKKAKIMRKVCFRHRRPDPTDRLARSSFRSSWTYRSWSPTNSRPRFNRSASS